MKLFNFYSFKNCYFIHTRECFHNVHLGLWGAQIETDRAKDVLCHELILKDLSCNNLTSKYQLSKDNQCDIKHDPRQMKSLCQKQKKKKKKKRTKTCLAKTIGMINVTLRKRAHAIFSFKN